MRRLRRLLGRLTWWMTTSARNQALLQAEIDEHIALQTADNVRAGFSPIEARRHALLKFGGVEVTKEAYRDQRGLPLLETLWRDIRHAIRGLWRTPAFTATVILTLALGIGVTSAAFALLNAVVLRDLPLDRPDRLMFLGTQNAIGSQSGVSYLDYQSWRNDNRAFSGLAASAETAMILGDEGRTAERVQGTFVTANTFRLIGRAPFLGRDFQSGDDQVGAPSVVIFAFSIWKNRFGGDPALIGRTVRVNDRPAVVIGIMPEGFQFPSQTDAWQPLATLPGIQNQQRDARTPGLTVYGRLRDGVTEAEARKDLNAIVSRLARDYPATNRNILPFVVALSTEFQGPLGTMLLALMGAVSFILLIACINTGNLLLVRSTQRMREVALRVSLGATRSHIVLQLAAECGLLSILAGALGFGLAGYFVRLWVALIDGPGPYWVHWTVDARVFVFSVAVSIGTALLFGLVPALRLLKIDLNEVLKDGGRSVSGGSLRGRWTSALIAVELAATLVLLVGTGLMMRSFFALYDSARTIDSRDLLATRLTLPIQKYRTADQRKDLVARLEQQVGSLPGIAAVAVAYQSPLNGGDVRRLSIEGRNMTGPDGAPSVTYLYVGPRYFETLKVPLLQGRDFAVTDGPPGYETAIVNQRLAATLFPNESPLGKRIRLANAGPAAFSATPSAQGTARWLTIVGVSADVPQRAAPGDLQDPVVYVPYREEPEPVRSASLIVRGQPNVDVVPSIREAVHHVEPDLALYMVFTMEQMLGMSRGPQRIFADIFVMLACIALVLSSVGLYAVTAYGVAQRTQEIGVRMALGAEHTQLVRLFVKQTAVPLAIGAIVGVGGALAAGQLLQSLLVHTTPRDPLVLIVVTPFLAIVAMTAAIVPARRAVQVDPMVALRHS